MVEESVVTVWLAIEPAGLTTIDAWYALRNVGLLWLPPVRRARSYQGVGDAPPFLVVYESRGRRARDARSHGASGPSLEVAQAVARSYRLVARAGEDAIHRHLLTVALTPHASRSAATRVRLARELNQALDALHGVSTLVALEAAGPAAVVGGERGLVGGAVLDGPPFLVLCEVSDAAREMSIAAFWADRAVDLGGEARCDLCRLLDVQVADAAA